ncbi:hypothetical protein KC19_VG181300, partial [Ceratodon purpureus]
TTTTSRSSNPSSKQFPRSPPQQHCNLHSLPPPPSPPTATSTSPPPPTTSRSHPRSSKLQTLAPTSSPLYSTPHRQLQSPLPAMAATTVTTTKTTSPTTMQRPIATMNLTSKL